MNRHKPQYPNNFPRGGQHNPVTRDVVQRLQADRPTFNAELDYTIGGTVETHVHSNLNAEREAAITSGSRALQQASNRLRDGAGKSEATSRAEYIRQQKAAAMRGAFRERTHEKTPSR